jgi:hypothetical protein
MEELAGQITRFSSKVSQSSAAIQLNWGSAPSFPLKRDLWELWEVETKDSNLERSLGRVSNTSQI